MRQARLLLLFGLAIASLAATAQPSSAADRPLSVSLGESTITLDGPWRFAAGDSPGVGGNFVWASPAFDDSSWSHMDLHAPAGSTDAAYGGGGYVTGWSARGFPRLAGFGWYRLRIQLDDPAQRVWLKMPDHVDDSYQVFANGAFVGQFGSFTAGGVDSYRSRPLTFALPAPDAHGDLLLALRFYMEPWVLVSGSTGDSGGMHGAPLLGLRSAIAAAQAREITGRLLSIMVSLFVALFLLIGAGGAFWLWLLDRPSTTYLWLTLGLILVAASTGLLLVAFFSYTLTQNSFFIWQQICNLLGVVCWVFFWRRWFELPRERWSDLLLAFYMVVIVLFSVFIGWSKYLPLPVITLAFYLEAAANTALGIVLFLTLLRGARKDRAGALIALLPIALLTIALFSPILLSWFYIRTAFFPYGLRLGIGDVALVLLVLVTGALVVRRFVLFQVKQRLESQRVGQELEQARELQQHVLVPEPVHSPLFAVETVYRPARTVGGDFFQAIAHPDGSLLIVVGDVSGKGIAAAMLVSVLVGAIRTRAEQSFDPSAMLRALNGRLVGRAGSHFATCLAAHLLPGGVMLVASAGHIPPYRNGIALDLPGALPLGLDAEAAYAVHAIQLEPGDHLTLLTDGVPEARDSSGKLLGFERTEQLSTLDAAAIAHAAMAHGQEDDITVVSVRVRARAQEAEWAGEQTLSPGMAMP